jgi:hypothetical protein
MMGLSVERSIMTLQQPHYGSEVVARKGDALYETAIRPLVEDDN